MVVCAIKQKLNVFHYFQNLDKEGAALPDGFRLTLRVEASAPPLAAINEEMVDKVKLVMSSRYVAENKALDLKKFYADRQFLGEPVYAPLARSNIMAQV